MNTDTVSGNDSISGFQAGAGSDDFIQLASSTFANFDAVLAATSDVGENTEIMLETGVTITLIDLSKSELHEDDFQFV